MYLFLYRKMSAIFKTVATGASKLVSPAFYHELWKADVAWIKKCESNGNAMTPIFTKMLLVGIIGIFMSYVL